MASNTHIPNFKKLKHDNSNLLLQPTQQIRSIRKTRNKWTMAKNKRMGSAKRSKKRAMGDNGKRRWNYIQKEINK